MNADVLHFSEAHFGGQSATNPIELPLRGLGALLVLAGISLPPPLAYPVHTTTAHSGMSNYGF